MARRKIDKDIISLMHFDYPYFAEPGDGMRDEAGIFTWTNNKCIFVGTEIPVAKTVSGTPKFGYRCLESSSSAYLQGTTSNGLSLNASNNLEIGFFIRVTASSAGNICLLMTDDTPHISISLTAERIINVNASAFNLSASSSAITLNTWTYILIRIASNVLSIYVNGTQAASKTGGTGTFKVNRLRLGGFTGQLDEFSLRQGVSTQSVPSGPIQGRMSLNDIGGEGTGKHGSVTISNTGQSVNSYALVTGISGNTITVSDWAKGLYGEPVKGDELMLHVTRKRGTDETLIGMFDFVKILSVSGRNIQLESKPTEFDITGALKNYYVQAILVPNYKTFTVTGSVQPVLYTDAKGGGITVIRSSGDVRITGSIITNQRGPVRDDKIQMTHSTLPDRFICSRNGGVIILSGGTVTTQDTSRLGSSWDGSVKGGAGQTNRGGGNGGAGYGGGGGADTYHSPSIGGAGGVGGGGGGGYNSAGGAAGTPSTRTGGEGRTSNINSGEGGAQGITPGGNGVSRGGGGAGGCSSAISNQYSSVSGAMAGANVMIIADHLNISDKSISTGGEGGKHSEGNASGGAGTGFAYLAGRLA